MAVKLRMTGSQHANIKEHVISRDGKEAASLLFCRPVFRGQNTILLVKGVENIPYDVCSQRTETYLSWPTEKILLPKYEYLENDGLSLIILHSHPTGAKNFSTTDDNNDRKIFSRLVSSIEGDQPHGSAIMLPDGEITARTYDDENQFTAIDKIVVAGDNIRVFSGGAIDKLENSPAYMQKTSHVYGAATTNILRDFKIGIVGCSGTGSPMIEITMRYNVGRLVLIDHDVVEEGNLNRMIMSRAEDAKNAIPKVERYKQWQAESELPTAITALQDVVPSDDTIKALSECDVIFGCVDNVVARHSLNKIACAYLIPYFDLGVAIKPDPKNPENLRQVIARCHYIQPDQSCLLDREAFSAERLANENFRRDDPEFYKILKEAGYTDKNDEVQAVLVLTMEAACLGMDDLMARLHNYRIEPNKNFDQQDRSFTHGYYEHFPHSTQNMALRNFIATGDNHTRL